jgi:hypothetical protein
MRTPFKTHRHPHMLAAVVEQRRLLGHPDRPARKRASLNASLSIELARLGYRLLNDAPSDAHAPHQPPVAVDLPVLPYRRVRRYMRPIESDSSLPENTEGWHYTPKSPPCHHQPIDPTRSDSRKIGKMDIQLRKLG